MSVDPQAGLLAPLLGGILIGGTSRRMGTPKALLEWEKETFVERIARALAGVVSELVLFGSGVELPGTLAQHAVVADAGGARGPLAGLLAAFELRPDAAWLMVTCDQPLLSTGALEWLIAERRTDRIAVVTRLTPDRIEPFPGIYEPRSRPELAALATPREGAAVGRRGSLQPLAGHPAVRIVDVPVRLALDFLGANTPEELAALRRRVDRAGRPDRPGTDLGRDGKRRS